MILFFDTETSGLPLSRDRKVPSSNVENWPRMIQLAFLLTKNDGTEIEAKTLLIRPNGFAIPQEATNIHGITTEMAMALGVEPKLALEMFWECQQTGMALDEEEFLLVAHNADFDGKVIRAECHRAGVDPNLTKGLTICTMESSRYFCAFPRNKWPKLTELHQKLFGSPHENAHDAMGDVLATKKCFFELRRIGVISETSFLEARQKQEKIKLAVEAKAEKEAVK